MSKPRLDYFIYKEEISFFKNFVKFNALKLQEEQTKINKTIKDEKADLFENFHYIDEVYRDEIDAHFEFFPKMYYNSMLVNLYSFLEYHLTMILKISQKATGKKVKLQDINASNQMEKCKKYLSLVLELRMENLNKEWEVIMDISKLRNLIVHNNSNLIVDEAVGVEQQKNFPLIKKYAQSIAIKVSGVLIIENESLILKFTESIECFLNKIIQNIELKYYSGKNDDLLFRGEDCPF